MNYDDRHRPGPNPRYGWIFLAIAFPSLFVTVWMFFASVAQKPIMGEHYETTEVVADASERSAQEGP